MKSVRIFSWIVCVTTLCLLTSGCFGSSRSKSPPGWDGEAPKNGQTGQQEQGAAGKSGAPQELAKGSDGKEPVSVAAEKLLDKIIKGMSDGDYAVYSADFTDSLKLVIPAGKFVEDIKNKKNTIGDYVSRAFLTELIKGDRRICLWKAKFNKTEDDVLIRIVIEKDGAVYKVSSLWIQ